MNAWTDGLDPGRLAAHEARRKTMVYVPPSPAAISDNAARALISAQWARQQNAAATEFAETFAPYGLEMQQRAKQEAKDRAAEAQKQATAKREAAERDEERHNRQQAAILATSADTSEAIAAIRAQISAILGA